MGMEPCHRIGTSLETERRPDNDRTYTRHGGARGEGGLGQGQAVGDGDDGLGRRRGRAHGAGDARHGAGFFSPQTSHAKAVAAANFRRSTKELGEMALKGSAFWAAVPAVLRGEILPSIGGVPITKGGKVIGAIGCGGGTGEQDHECAEAGAAAVGA